MARFVTRREIKGRSQPHQMRWILARLAKSLAYLKNTSGSDRPDVPSTECRNGFAACRACCPLVAASAPTADLKPESAHARRSTSATRGTFHQTFIRAKLDPRWPGLGDGLNPQSLTAPRDASPRLCSPMPSSSLLASRLSITLFGGFPSYRPARTPLRL
ncbi:hypothetical protein FDECE_14968 [Fusarium decemcellulare]|nr:hypothetical protein FDECE_14968 [Fusarium decemcellulare]